MVAVVSGSGLGLGLTSLHTLGQRGLIGTAAQGRSGEQSYINVANGNLVLQSLDEAVVARGLDLATLRTYNSQGKFNDDNGDNWAFGIYSQQVKLTGTLNAAGSTLTRTDGSGGEAVYSWDSVKSLYVSTVGAGAYDTLAAVGADYVWTDGDTGMKEYYLALSGRLTSAADAAGNTLSYAYNAAGNLTAMTSANGDVTYLDYTGSNVTRVRTVTSGGVTLTRTSYGYDASNRLVTVTVDLSPGDNSVADGKVYQTTYTYDGTSKRVTSVVQGDGTSLVFTYVLVGTEYRVATVKDGLNQSTSYSYNTANRRTTVTDPLGFVTVYEYNVAGELVSVTAPPVGGVSQVTTYSYNASGDLVQVLDALGQAVVMQYDANGNQVLQRDAAGNTVTRTFDARNQMLTETVYTVADPDGAGAQLPTGSLTTRYVYDAAGKNLLRFVLSSEGRVTEYVYDAWGQRTSSIEYGAALYNVSALGVTASPLVATMTTWVGTQNKSLTRRTDMVLDARGQLQSTTAYAKVSSAGAGMVDGSESKTQFIYDQAGLLLQTISATAGTTVYTYDGLGRVLSEQNALVQTTLYSYDDAGRKMSVTLAGGLTSTRNYDAAGRLVSLVQSSAQSANLGTVLYFYDADNRLVMTQDPTGVRAWQLYDEAGRKVANVDGNGSLTEYVYDRSNRVTQTIAYATAVSTAALVNTGGQPLSPVLSSIRPAAVAADRKAWQVFDEAGRLLKTVDGQGAVVLMTYDGTSRLVKTTGYANLITTTNLGPAPTSASVVPAANAANDRVSRYIFDADGLLRATLDGEGYLTELRYDAAGRLLSRIAYATVTTASQRASGTLAQLTPATAAGDITTRVVSDGKGQVIGEVDGQGYLTEKVYDASGNLTQSIRYATVVNATVLAAFSATTTLAALRPAGTAQDRSTSNTYDVLNRLSQTTDASGIATQFTYDLAGNLVKTVSAASMADVRTVNARFDVQGRLTGELTGVGSALLTGGQTQAQIDAVWSQYGLIHSHDAAGRRTGTTDGYGNRTLFFYDVDGQLTHTVNAAGEVRENQYNKLGQLVAVIDYGARISLSNLTAGYAGGLVNTALTTAVAAVRNVLLDSKKTMTYDSTGALASVTDALGNATTLTYNAFGDDASRVQALGGALGTLTETSTVDRRGLKTGTVLDALGINAVSSAIYDAFGRMTSSTDANGRVNTQVYDRLGRVVSTLDALGTGRSSTYDAFSRVLTMTDGLGNVTSYSYDKVARSMTVTTPEGVAVTTVMTRHGQTQSVTDGRGNTTTFTYDQNGNQLTVATALATTSQTFDRSNRLATTTDSNGNQVLLAYDAANRLLSRRVDPTGLNLITSYSYDAKGQQITVTSPTGTVTQLTYDLKGQVTKQTVDPTGLNLVTSYTYDGRGKTLTVVDPMAVTTLYAYDKLGRRLSECINPTGTGALNITRSYVYDKGGNVTSSTDANLNVTRYVYDASDRLVYTVDASGNLRENKYDAEGRLIKTVAYAAPISLTGLAVAPTAADVLGRVVVTAAADSIEHRVYDQDGRMVATVNALGEVVRLVYNASGNVIERVAYASRVPMSGGSAWVPGTMPQPVADAVHDQRLRTVYDQLGRAVYAIDGAGAVVKQVFDADGKLTEKIAYTQAVPAGTAATAAAIGAAVVVSAADQRTRYVYDKANRLTHSADGAGSVTALSYDKSGNVTREIRYATVIAGATALTAVVVSAADRITVFGYDKADRRTHVLDALGGVTRTIYDKSGNVTQTVAYKNRITPPTTGAILMATAIQAAVVAVAAEDRITRYAYDAANRPVYVIDATGAAMRTTYDGAGNAVQTTQYATLVNTSSLSATATVSAVAALIVVDAANDRVERRAFDASQRQVFGVDALGYVSKTVYDGVGRVKSTTAYGLAIPAATANTAAAIQAAVVVSAAIDRTSTSTYDAAGRLASSQDALGFIESYTYNAIGEKLSFTNKNGAVWTYDYDAAGRMVKETSPQVGLAGVQVNPSTGSLEINPAVTLVASVVTALAYDALGNLLMRTEAVGRPEARTTSYEYDALGRQVRTFYPSVAVYDGASDNVTVNGATGMAARVEATYTLYSETAYDAFGDAVVGKDIAGSVSYKAYDKLGRVRHEVDALGYVTSYVRNTFGEAYQMWRLGAATGLASGGLTAISAAQVDTAVNASGVDHNLDRLLQTEYDRLGRTTKVIEHWSYTYDRDNAQQHSISSKITRSTYDAFGNLRQTSRLKDAQAQTWNSTENFYDKVGQLTSSIDAMGYVTTQAFDAAGNVVTRTEFAAAVASWNTEILHAAPPAAVASDDDRKTLTAWDKGNRKVSETRVNVEFSASTSATTASRANLVTAHTYDNVGNLTGTTDASGATTYSYYDALGRVTGIAAPTRTDDYAPGGAVALTPLTLFSRDAYGNVVYKVEMANSAQAVNASTYVPGAVSASDRTTFAAYDRFSHVIQSTDAQGFNHYSSYDARGNIAKEWQGITGSDGVQRTKFRVYQYDKLGRQTHIIDPASTTVLQSGLTTQFASDTVVTDESGLFVMSHAVPNSVSLGWSSLIDANGGLVRVQVDYQTVSTYNSWRDDRNRLMFSGMASRSASQTRDYTGAAAGAGVTVSWANASDTDGGISQLGYVRVWQQNSAGTWIIKWEGTAAQANGSGIVTVAQQAAGVVDTAMEYNAFGEMTRRGVNGGREEYFEYDTAGNLWRTNSGDGVDKIALYDLQGRQTADIRSAGVGKDNAPLSWYGSPDTAAAATNTQRVDIRYDALGRVVQQLQPERLETQGGVTVKQESSISTVTSSGSIFSQDQIGNPYNWIGTNNVNLGWSSLAALGSGEVKVIIDYVTKSYTALTGTNILSYDEMGVPFYERDQFGNMVGTPTVFAGVARSIERTMPAEQAQTGAAFTWLEPLSAGALFGSYPDPQIGGIETVTRIRLHKKDVNGYWQEIIDTSTIVEPRQVVEIATPTDPSTIVEFEYRPAGTAGTAGWIQAPFKNFGDTLRMDASSLGSGALEYRVLTTIPGRTRDVVALGTVSNVAVTVTSIQVPIGFGQPGTASGVLAWGNPGSNVVQVLRTKPLNSNVWTTQTTAGQAPGYSGVNLSGLAAGGYDYELLWIQSGQSAPYAHATGQISIVPPTTSTQTIVPPDPANYIVGYSPAQYVAPLLTPVFTGYDESGAPTYSYQVAPHYQWSGNVIVAVPYSEQHHTGWTTEYYQVQVWVQGPPIIIGYDESWNPIYARDESGNIQYQQVLEWQTHSRQVPVYTWVTITPADPANWMTVPSRPIYGAPVTYEAPIGQNESGGWIYETRLTEHYQWSGNVAVAVPYNVTTPVAAQYHSTVTTAAGGLTISQASAYQLAQTSVGINGTSQMARPILNQKTDRWGNVTEINDLRSENWKTLYKYNANNQLIEQRQTDADGNHGAGSAITNIYYDKEGRQLAVKDANGNVNRQEYDAAGNLVREVHADNSLAYFRYNAFGNKISTADTYNNTTLFTYDKLDRLLVTARTAVSRYSITPGMTLSYDGTSSITDISTWDQAGRKLTSTNGAGEVLRYTYDLAGNVVTTQLPMGQITRATFDNQGRKTAEVDGNNYSSTWRYDYFGSLYAHTDLGGASYSYTYDNARQLIAESNTRGLHILYGYDAAGQLTTINDVATGKVTTYAWDRAGHRIREKVTQHGYAYQDNHIAYDALGRMRWVGDARSTVTIGYDKAGNRTSIQTHVAQGSAEQDQARFFQYDAMNRQIVIDAVNQQGALGSQGHAVTYDYNGNRVTDTSSAVAEVYTYDANNRLNTVTKNGVLTDQRLYDGAGRIVQSGAAGTESSLSRYDANGRLIQQRVQGPTGAARYQLNYNNYDGAGNLVGHTLQSYEGSYTNTYATTQARFDTYKEASVSSTSSYFQPGSTTSNYDANGFLTSVTDSTNSGNNRSFVTDAGGKVLRVQQGSNVQRQLIVAGEVLGRYGDQTDGSGFKADFNFSYQAINGTYPAAAPASYTIMPGDTLQSISKAVYGDSGLWYRIAEANGLSGNDFIVGQTLTIPNKVGTAANNVNTFKPYDPSAAVGDTTPYMAPPPQGNGGCGGFGAVLVAVIVIAVAVVSQQYYLMNIAIEGATVSAGSMAAAGAVGSVAGQIAGNILGVQDGFSWKQVALSAVSAGVAGGVASVAGQGTLLDAASNPLGQLGATVTRSALSNAVSQGIGVVTGLQSRFDWKSVAASAIGSGVGYGVGNALGAQNGTFSGDFGESVFKSTLKGLSAGTAVALARGGKVAVQQIATDAFGNALGASIAERASSVGSVGYETNSDAGANEDVMGAFIELNDGWRSVSATPTFAEDMATRRAGLNSLGLSTSGGSSSAMGAPPAQSEPRTYTVQRGDNPASIGRAFYDDERAGAAILAANGLSSSVRGARSLQIGQMLTMPDDISEGNLRAGGKLIGADSAIRAQDAAASAQAASNAYADDGMRIGPTIARAQAMGGYSGGGVDAAYQARLDASPRMTAWDGVSHDTPAVTYLKQSLGGLDPVRGDQMQFRVAQSLPEAALNELGGLAVGKVLGSVLGWAEKVTPRVTYLDPNEAFSVINTAKGMRPMPDTYLPQSMIDAHASLFENGVVRIQPNVPTGTIGRSETWVMPKTFADSAVAEAGGDVAKLEQLLGLDKGYLGASPVRVDIPRPVGLRMSSGNEWGANNLWNPGGYTNGGIPEAIIKPVPSGVYMVTPIKVK